MQCNCPFRCKCRIELIFRRLNQRFVQNSSACLAHLLKEMNSLPEDLALHYLHQSLGALEHLHHRKVLHLDVKGELMFQSLSRGFLTAGIFHLLWEPGFLPLAAGRTDLMSSAVFTRRPVKCLSAGSSVSEHPLCWYLILTWHLSS